MFNLPTLAKARSAFTLIELMIVIAIIAVLANIAIPAYGNFITRSRVAELLTVSAAAKNAVTEYAIANNALPRSSAQAGVNGVNSTYVSSLNVDENGVINIIGNAEALKINKIIISLTPSLSNGTVTWLCSSTGDTQYAPSNRR